MSQPEKSDKPRTGYATSNGRVANLALKIGNVMLAERHRKHWTWDIAKRVGTTPGTAHSVFRNFERNGWVKCQYEDTNADSPHRQPRVLYSLTADGVVAIRDALIPFQHAPVST